MGPSARRVASDLALDALVLAVAAAHVFLAPYAKVEESIGTAASSRLNADVAKTEPWLLRFGYRLDWSTDKRKRTPVPSALGT